MNFVEFRFDGGKPLLINLDNVYGIVKDAETGNAILAGDTWKQMIEEPYEEIAIRIKEKEDKSIKQFMHHFKRIMYEVRR